MRSPALWRTDRWKADTMALSYRKRRDVWHSRGTFKVGRRTFTVREFSTGTTTKADAVSTPSSCCGQRAGIH